MVSFPFLSKQVPLPTWTAQAQPGGHLPAPQEWRWGSCFDETEQRQMTSPRTGCS